MIAAMRGPSAEDRKLRGLVLASPFFFLLCDVAAGEDEEVDEPEEVDELADLPALDALSTPGVNLSLNDIKLVELVVLKTRTVKLLPPTMSVAT